GKTTEKLGFSIGAQVVCHPEAGWEPGVVVDHWYPAEGFRPSFRAPYQVQLDDEDGTLIRLATQGAHPEHVHAGR
ncbi:unnamed protein product, partial [Prorocentrum cordatum]